jgi:2-hydroxychromene-2-carboxylate isomerase
MANPTLEFNYDISCPFAYIASTRVSNLTHLTNCTIIYKPVLLGAIYRSTSAPQGAAGSASDVFNPTKKAVASKGMARTLKRYKIEYNPPAEHPRKSVDALRLLYNVDDGPERIKLTNALFRAYWVENRDVTSRATLLEIASENGITHLSEASFSNPSARQALENATANAIERGAFGVPGFWIPDATWTDVRGSQRRGRYFWGQDRLHFVAATLLSLSQKHANTNTNNANPWSSVPGLQSLMPRCTRTNTVSVPTKLQFWFDFSSPWAFLGYTQLARLRRTFGPKLETLPPRCAIPRNRGAE